jgi:16S rRNA (guanine966-N2)-methyltransferase
VRIISGSLGGREIRAPRGDRTRPTSDKVRQATFNILGNTIGGTFDNVLDLYAGSGALGIEALSRGAVRAVFVDKASDALRVLAANLADLGLGDRGAIVRGDVTKVLPRLLLAGPFSLVFFDPPYRLFTESDEAERALALVPPLLAPGATVVVEHDRRSSPEATIGPLSLRDRRRYGDTEVSFYQ